MTRPRRKRAVERGGQLRGALRTTGVRGAAARESDAIRDCRNPEDSKAYAARAVALAPDDPDPCFGARPSSSCSATTRRRVTTPSVHA